MNLYESVFFIVHFCLTIILMKHTHTKNLCSDYQRNQWGSWFILKILVLRAGDDSAVKNTCSSCQGCTFISQHHRAAHNHLYSGSKGIWRLLQPPRHQSHTWYIHTYIQAKHSKHKINVFKRLQFLRAKIIAVNWEGKKSFFFYRGLMLCLQYGPFPKILIFQFCITGPLQV